MKVFLTGTSGLLGSNIAYELLNRGYEVRGLFRHAEELPDFVDASRIEHFYGDITDAETMTEGISGCDAVIHAAADTRQWPDRSEEYVATNVQGTKNVIHGAKKAGVKRMVHVSTANSVGFGTKEHPGNETMPPTFEQYGIGYMETKYQAQQIVLTEVAQNNFPAVIVNPTFMIGPGDSKPSSGQMILAIYQGKVPGYPSGGKNYVYVRDAATAAVNALQIGRIGECYILGNENMSYKEMFTKTAKIVGAKAPRIPIPAGVTKAFGFLSGLLAPVFGKAPNVSYKMARVSCDGHYFSAAKAVRELNMPQTPIDIAIKECFEWFKANGYLDGTRNKKLTVPSANSSYQIEEVKDKESKEAFHELPFKIYQNDPHWIPAVKQEVEAVFDPKVNTFFQHGRAIRWIMKDASGQVIGRVAAFVNERKAYTYKQPTGGMGFFECIDDQEAANVLFNQCKSWLQKQGMEAMDGPINFGENNKYWGLILENFSMPPYYGQNYTPEYYVPLFESYGFQIYFRQFIFNRSFYMKMPERYQRRIDRIHRNGEYQIKEFDKKKAKAFAKDFMEVYNDAWQTHDNFKPMTEAGAMAQLKQIAPVLDTRLILFVYYREEPVAFIIALPNINELFKKVDGNMNLLGKLKFLYHQKTTKIENVFGVAFGVKTRYQLRGVDGLIFDYLSNAIYREASFPYRNYIVTWIGDFNPKMVAMMEALGSTKTRTMATMRKLFDEHAVFERSPIIGLGREKGDKKENEDG